MPSVRAIEKEAYRWADLGIDTLEEAAVYMQNQLQLQSRAGRIRQVLQIADRRLTPGEEKLIHTWLSWGFGEDEIRMAYEKTCMNTGGLKWPYLNSILKSRLQSRSGRRSRSRPFFRMATIWANLNAAPWKK